MRRVVVTGMGAITPIGNDVETFWNGLKEKKLGFGPISYFDTTDYKAKLAAEVKDFEPKDYMDPKAARRMERFAQFAVAAARQALAEQYVAEALAGESGLRVTEVSLAQEGDRGLLTVRLDWQGEALAVQTLL